MIGSALVSLPDLHLCKYILSVKRHVCSLGELVKHDENGLIFSTESELKQQLEVISRCCTRRYCIHYVIFVLMPCLYICLS